MKILFVSLGCDKNLVDTEYMLGILGNEGYAFTDDERGGRYHCDQHLLFYQRCQRRKH